MKSLSPAQQVAATTRGHVLIAACPGSGKTTVLKHRAQYLLESDNEAKLAAVTFTKEAAASLRERIVQQYPAAARRIEAGTFHNLCIGQLRRAGISKKILNEGGAARMVYAAINACPHKDPNLQLDDYKQAIESWQREVHPVIPPRETSATSWVYGHYTSAKLRLGVWDFGDMLREAVLGMREGKVKPLDVKYMLVDEFQDTDNIQLEWCLEHVKNGTQITIVGDDDQAIYGWRGSLGYNGMLRFKDETDATMITLDRTYRCSLEVMASAAALIEHNKERVPKSLQTANSEKGVVRPRTFEDREAECQAIIDAVLESEEPGSWGILARTNSLLDEVETRILKQFNFVRPGGRSFWDQKAPQMLKSLAASIAGRDMMGVSELMTAARVPASVLDQLSSDLRFDQPGSLDRFIKSSIPRAARGGDREFISNLQEQSGQWRDMFKAGGRNDIQLAITGMALNIYKNGGWKTDALAETGQRLNSAASSIASMKGSIQQRMHLLDQPINKGNPENAASLLTLHASKGLEFDRVWILGCETGVIPSAREGSDTAEERRLMYVGITRAKANLTLSFTLNKMSEFLKETQLMGRGMFQKDH